jgi:hypothetical protein
MKRDRLVRSTPKIVGNEVLKILESWNSTPETSDYLKNVAMAVLSILSSTYLFLFSVTS